MRPTKRFSVVVKADYRPASSPGRGWLKKSSSVLEGRGAGRTKSELKPDDVDLSLVDFFAVVPPRWPNGVCAGFGLFLKPSVVAVREKARFVSAFILAKLAETRSIIDGPLGSLSCDAAGVLLGWNRLKGSHDDLLSEAVEADCEASESPKGLSPQATDTADNSDAIPTRIPAN